MSSLKIDLKTVEQLRSKHSRLSSTLSNAANQLSSAAYGVDPAIKARMQLQYRIAYATQRMRELEDRMYRLNDFMRSAIEQYDSAEGQIKNRIGEITVRQRRSWLENLFDGVGDSYNALTDWLASEDGKRFAEQAKANAAAQANSSHVPEEPIDYTQFVGSHYWDNTKDGSFFYYEDYDGSLKSADIAKASALLTEYESALGVNYHEAAIFDPHIDDLTDFFIYTIHKGYDPRTFEPIDAQKLSNIENYINGRKMVYEIHRQNARAWQSLAIDLMPFVGQVRSLTELAIGKNLVTGKKLDGWDYGLGAAGTVFSAVKSGDKLYGLLKGAKKLDNVAENFDKVKIVDKGAGKLTIPQGLTAEQFSSASSTIRQKVGSISDDILVQGSRANGTARVDSDIDFAVRVSPEKFDELISQRFGSPNPGSAKEKTMLHAIETGKIQAGEAGLRSLRQQLQQELGIDVDISIIKSGGAFDNGPYIPLK
ncbi:pre-toxin TG domain-containing protein [Cohnella panacarvi]|uniref:pre-toxin TG domain-containing protein n=1 Tax=Cohnella panacarvi TaxID=400776 RepID=UPI00047959B6|nr:pre-toxin TG domain-containing protein [Cohnella panacarvi]